MSDPGHSSKNGTHEAAALLLFCRTMGTQTLFAAGSELFHDGDAARAFLIEEGEVELTLAAGKRKMPLGKAFGGQLLGLAAVIRNSPHECSATAKTDCRVMIIGAEAMRSFLKQHPESCLQTLQFLGAEILDLSSNVIRPLRLQPRYPKF